MGRLVDQRRRTEEARERERNSTRKIIRGVHRGERVRGGLRLDRAVGGHDDALPGLERTIRGGASRAV